MRLFPFSKALRAQMDQEAAQAASQAVVLTRRFAEAEQELRFETNRNLQRRRAKDDESARLREAAVTAQSRLVEAEDALRRKDVQIKDLRARVVRLGLDRGKGMNAGGVQFEVFAATANARVASERCVEAVGKRRAVAGLAVGEALRLSRGQDAMPAVDHRGGGAKSGGEGERLCCCLTVAVWLIVINSCTLFFLFYSCEVRHRTVLDTGIRQFCPLF